MATEKILFDYLDDLEKRGMPRLALGPSDLILKYDVPPRFAEFLFAKWFKSKLLERGSMRKAKFAGRPMGTKTKKPKATHITKKEYQNTKASAVDASLDELFTGVKHDRARA